MTRTRRKTRRKKRMRTRRPTPSPEGFNGFNTINNGLVAPSIRLLNKFTYSRPEKLVLLTIVTPAGSLAVQFIDGLGTKL